MTAYIPPRRVTSTPTTITVTSNTTALSAAAAAASSGAFTRFDGNGLSTRTAHPSTGVQVNVTEDGASAGNTAIDWAGKGCYDPTTKRVMWASTGQGINGAAGTYVRNTYAVYDETANSNAGLWSAQRAFQPPGGTDVGIGHFYDSNCIDVTGRKFYKGLYNENNIAVFDLSLTTPSCTGVIARSISSPSLAERHVAMEFIPTRGTNGALWVMGNPAGSLVRSIWEKQLPGGAWNRIISSGIGSVTSGQEPYPMSYNPRSGLVFVGGSATNVSYVVDPATLAITTTGANFAGNYAGGLVMRVDGHVCKDPTGTGWLHFDARRTSRVYRCSTAGVWTDIGPMPGPGLGFDAGNEQPFCVTPIDAYGVVWLVRGSSTGGSPAAWLYKP